MSCLFNFQSRVTTVVILLSLFQSLDCVVKEVTGSDVVEDIYIITTGVNRLEK